MSSYTGPDPEMVKRTLARWQTELDAVAPAIGQLLEDDDEVTSGPTDDRDLYMDTADRWDDPDTNDGIAFARGDD